MMILDSFEGYYIFLEDRQWGDFNRIRARYLKDLGELLEGAYPKENAPALKRIDAAWRYTQENLDET